MTTEQAEELLASRTFLGIRDTAAVLDMGMTATRQAVQRGDIPSTRVSRDYRIPTKWLRAQLDGDTDTTNGHQE